MPQRIKSRRETCPSARALTISARLSRARCASLCRMRDALSDMYMALRPKSRSECLQLSDGVQVAPRAADFLYGARGFCARIEIVEVEINPRPFHGELACTLSIRGTKARLGIEAKHSGRSHAKGRRADWAGRPSTQ